MAVLITSHVQVSLGNKYNSYIHSAPNAKVTSVRNIYEKTVMKRKNKDFQRRIQNPLEHYDEAFLRKQLTGQGRRVVNVVDRVLNTTLVLIIAKKLPRRQDSLYSENRYFKQDRYFDETNKKFGNCCKQFMDQVLY